jgi:hypothetical protein
MHVRVVIVRNSYRLAIFLQLIGTAGASFFKANPFLSQDLFHFFWHSKLHFIPYCNTGKKYDFLTIFTGVAPSTQQYGYVQCTAHSQTQDLS